MIVGCPHCHLRYDISHRNPKEAVKCRCGASFMVPNLSNTARAWNCPNCGGATDSAKSKCEFCGVYLAFARCPDCISPVSRGSKFCSECGAYLLTPVKDAVEKRTDLNCPHCDKQLHMRKVGDYHMELCSRCGGTWLDHEVLEKILRDKGKQKNATAISGKKIRKLTPLSESDFVYRKCPYCKKIMHRRNFARKSGIVVDECVAHGIWFDKHELARIIDYAQSVIETPKSNEHYKPLETGKPRFPSNLPSYTQQAANADVVNLAVFVGEVLGSVWSKFWTK